MPVNPPRPTSERLHSALIEPYLAVRRTANDVATPSAEPPTPHHPAVHSYDANNIPRRLKHIERLTCMEEICHAFEKVAIQIEKRIVGVTAFMSKSHVKVNKELQHTFEWSLKSLKRSLEQIEESRREAVKRISDDGWKKDGEPECELLEVPELTDGESDDEDGDKLLEDINDKERRDASEDDEDSDRGSSDSSEGGSDVSSFFDDYYAHDDSISCTGMEEEPEREIYQWSEGPDGDDEDDDSCVDDITAWTDCDSDDST